MNHPNFNPDKYHFYSLKIFLFLFRLRTFYLALLRNNLIKSELFGSMERKN